MPRSQLLGALLATTALVAVPIAIARAQALPQATLPTGGQVASGSASIATTAPGQMTIQQASPTAVVNWQSFSIGQGGRVDIRQPNAEAAMLNRVTGTTPSSIAGQLNANGRVYLVNPNGIAIGPTGSVRAQGFVASTLDIADDDFRAGRRNFQGNGASAAVTNAGRIEVGRGGYAALLGGQVSNAGTISAPAGRIGLGAAERATLDLSGDGFLQVTLPSRGAGGEALATNSGTLSAPGGRVEISAATAREAARRAVNMSGVIEAQGVTAQGGAIVLSGGPGGEVAVSGRMDASSAQARGGSVTVTGQAIALQGARVEASGATGGGRVRVGGDREGRGSLPRAERVRADAATTIRADATQRGNGGDVVVWSDNRTDFAGRIEARGGPQGGDGGQAEVSSRTVLNYTGTADLRAAAGAWGTLLLDPYDITISAGTTSNATGFTATGNDSVINAGVLVEALGLANVTVSTGTGGTQAGNITVASPLAWATSATLTLQAAGGINLNAAITAPAGGLALQAGGTIGATGDVTVRRFELLGGAWVQNAATLAGLVAGDFRLTGGTFLRALGGAGSSADPWRLTDVYGVQGMATRLDGHYRLANDIAAAGTAGWNDGAGFRPIGTFGARFTGSLDGAGHVVTGLTINRPGQNEVGLFGVTGMGSAISRIGLDGGSVTGRDEVGSLVGRNVGTITQAYATGAVTGEWFVGGLVGSNRSTITQAYATGAVKGTGAFVGGLVGDNRSTIRQAYATGAVEGRERVGGLVGENTHTIEQAYATGAVTGTGAGNSVGGLVGLNRDGGTIRQAYATGAVTGRGLVGGLVGENTPLVLGDFVFPTITASFWDTQTTGRAVGVGDGPADGATGLTTAQARGQASYAGWNFATDWFQAGDMRPIGRWEAAQPGPDGVRVIRNLNQLQLMATDLGASYRLGTDINAAPTDASANSPGIWGAGGFVPVGTDAARFTGSLDGAGHVVSGLTINRRGQDTVGLFGATGTGSTISHIGLVGGSVTGHDFVGGLVGGNLGTITQAYATGAVTGTAAAGGLVGGNLGTITQAYATGAVTGTATAGGLVGFNSGTITQAYATGAVTGTGDVVGGLVGINNGGGTITQAYATGAVSGNSRIGGLVGWNLGTITASFWDTATTGRVAGVGTGSAAGATRLTTAQARGQASYATAPANWDFAANWFQAGDMRPIGRWEAAQPGPDGVRVIRNLNQLQLMAANLGASYRLGTDIDAAPTNATANSPGIWGAGGFVPVGTVHARFTGSLDGAGRTITGLNINWSAHNYVGLFGYTGTGSTIRNIGLLDGSVTGDFHVGGLAGANAGTITQAYSTGNVRGTGSIGGLVGRNYGTITQAYATGTVSGREAVGGLVGSNQHLSEITRAYATGAVSGPDTVGGLVGFNMGRIAQAYAIGALPQADGAFGGLVGANVAFGEITDSFWNTGTTGRLNAAGFNHGMTVAATGLTTAQMQDIASFRTTYAGWDFDTVWAPPNQVGQNNGAATAFYPQLYSLSNVAAVFVPNASREYGEANPVLGLPTYRGLRAGDTIGTLATLSSVGPTPTATSPAGTIQALTASGTTVNSPEGREYRIVHVPGGLTVIPRAITVTADAQGREYGDANPALTFALTRSGGAAGPALVNGDTLTGALATTATTASNVGGVAITQGNLAASPNYTLSFVGNTLTIAPRAITATANPQSREYGDANPTLTFALTRTGGAAGPALVNGDTLTGALTTTATTASNVGGYAITQGTLSPNLNYAMDFVGNTLAVTPRAITATANPQSREYGDANPTLTFALTRSGGAAGPTLVNGDTLTGALTTTATTASNVGGYAITQGSLSPNLNYAMDFVGNTLAVTPRAITATANPQSREYGDANPTLTFALTRSGGAAGPTLVNGDTLTGALATTATTASNVGGVAITQGNLAASPNYTLSFVGNTLTIAPRAITATANPQSREYGDANPTLTFATTRAGGAAGPALVNGDVLTGALATTATEATPVGGVAITQGNLAASSNYELSFVGDTLTITPRAITATADAQSRPVGDPNPPLTFALSRTTGTGPALVNGDTLTGGLATAATATSGVGPFAITQGTLAASPNYALGFVGNTLTVTPATPIVRPDAAPPPLASLPPASLPPGVGGSLAGVVAQPQLLRWRVLDGTSFPRDEAIDTTDDEDRFAGTLLCLGGAGPVCIVIPARR